MLQDYLTAPMPFLIGLPSELMPMLKHMPMNEVVLVNLEQGTVDPPGGAAADDARRLPWSDRLRSALEVSWPATQPVPRQVGDRAQEVLPTQTATPCFPAV